MLSVLKMQCFFANKNVIFKWTSYFKGLIENVMTPPDYFSNFNKGFCKSSQVSMAVGVQIMVLWTVTPRSV